MTLNQAAFSHDHKTVRERLDAGDRPDAQTLCNLALLESSSAKVQAVNLDLIKRVLEMGVDPNELPMEGHASAIDLACGGPNTDTVRALLDAGAKPTANSTVHCAIAEDHADNLQLLIDLGIDMTAPMENEDEDDDYTPTPLAYARELGSSKCLKLLTAHLDEA